MAWDIYPGWLCFFKGYFVPIPYMSYLNLDIQFGNDDFWEGHISLTEFFNMHVQTRNDYFCQIELICIYL